MRIPHILLILNLFLTTGCEYLGLKSRPKPMNLIQYTEDKANLPPAIPEASLSPSAGPHSGEKIKGLSASDMKLLENKRAIENNRYENTGLEPAIPYDY